jgi:L-ascorbate metabolism protein UlaG (beta-lactamase superfamily)
MARTLALLTLVLVCLPLVALAQATSESEVVKTSQGDLKITFIGHGTLMFNFDGKVLHVDPWSKLADYSKLPKADIILITHEHPDHLDVDAIKKIRNDKTVIVLTENCSKKVDGQVVMRNGSREVVSGIGIQAVPAYNLVHKRDTGQPFHPEGVGNGYVITFGDKRVYVAGDTENTPEMKALKNIDIAFLPMNLPYTMTPEMVADAAKAFKPKVLYPYHTGDTNLSKLSALMKGVDGVEVRIRKMK